MKSGTRLRKINSMSEVKEIIAFKKEDFRKWLEKNYNKEKRISVVLYKRHTGKDAPTHRELMEEAICFGWIDTTIKRFDEERYIRNFSKRNKNSKWSDNTLSYGKQLIKEGRMTPEGLKYYKEGLSRPTHDHGIPKNPDMPEELKEALLKDEIAKEKFENFTPSARRMIYRWFLSAKLPETRKKRIKIILDSAKEGKKNIL